jgi:two-component system, OmpR family, phosphate regulon response regulator PhoB
MIIAHVAHVAHTVSPPRGRYTVGPLEIDVEEQRVSVGGVPIQVSRMEIRLLAYLVEHRGQIRTRNDLLSEVWGYSPRATTRTAVIHIARLRSKLGEAADLIETVYGAGYRLSTRYPVLHQTR